MARDTYDVVTVGGGLGGATLARAMVERGARVLVLERERQFKDRVRGEWMAPWGAAEARALGIYDLLLRTCAHALPAWDAFIGPMFLGRRVLAETTPQGLPALALYHPAMQEVLLGAAQDAGAEVRRGVMVRDVKPGAWPAVVVEEDGRSEEIRARLVVAADGRTSLGRRWGGFTVRRAPERLTIAGILLDGVAAPEESSHIVFNVLAGQSSLLFPQGGGRARAYVVCQKDGRGFHGEADVRAFVAEAIRLGTPAEFYTDARPAGPLATFDTADTWVDHPYRAGVALVGDAASSSDPAFGQGLSLTLRDVRVLRDHLVAGDDWEAAGHAYAAAHDAHYGTIRRVNDWFTDMFFGVGPEADARLARALPGLAGDPTRVPDQQISGPDVPADEAARRRFFGED